MSFDRVETAQRMRDAIQKFAREQARIVSPPPMIARMVNVDPVEGTGEAWIIGDSAPVPVVLPVVMYPGKWDQRNGGIQDNPQIRGGGSIVVLHKYNDKLYVSEVLSGGQVMFRPYILGAGIVAQQSEQMDSAFIYPSNGMQNGTSEWIYNERLLSGQPDVTSFDALQNVALVIGPFSTDGYASGRVELQIDNVQYQYWQAHKYYDFTLNVKQIFMQEGYIQGTAANAYGQWFRLLPHNEAVNGTYDNINDPNNTVKRTDFDFDIDICAKPSKYTDNEYDVWFRLYQYKNDGAHGDLWFSIRTTSLYDDRPLKVKKSIVQEVDMTPPAVVGYVGFHNACHIYHDSRSPTWKGLFIGNQWESGPWRGANLRLAQDLQRTFDLPESENWYWDGANLDWSGQLKFSGVGYHRNGLKNGSFYLTRPPNGTVIPIMGMINGSTTVTSNGIPLAAYQALYLAIPPAITDTTDNYKYLFIADDYSDDYQLPEWAVMIAHRPRGTNSVRLGNGQKMYPWIQPTLNSPFTNRGGGYAPVRYRKFGPNMVQFDGHFNLNGAAAGAILFNMPAGYRPKTYVSSIALVGPASNIAGSTPNIELNTNGDLRVWGAPSSGICSTSGGLFVLQ